MKSPFPWFGGKSSVSHLVWDRFGNVANAFHGRLAAGTDHRVMAPGIRIQGVSAFGFQNICLRPQENLFRCISEQNEAAAQITAGHTDQRGLRQGIDDWLMEEAIERSEVEESTA